MSIRSIAVSCRSICCLAALCCTVVRGSSASAQTGNPTVITGTVYSPNGPTNGDPIPNILVFIAGGPVSGFTAAPTGPGVTGGCYGQSMLVSGDPIVSATTDYMGNFTLSNAALTALGTTTVNLVIQAGKWRRQYPNTQIIGGQINAPLSLSMPGTKNETDGTIADLPHIAVVTGAVDGLECIFPQIGISKSEITNPDGTGSIHLYAGSAAAGAVITAPTSSDPTPPETTLVTNPTLMDTYDVIMFACQGTPTQPVETTTSNQTNILNYANAGGRIFTTHWQYLWLDSSASFPTVATWLPPPPLGTTATSDATINISSTFTEGVILANWMHYIGADTGTLGQIILKNTAINTSQVNVPPSQTWVTLNNVTGNPAMQFTFDTPIGQTGIPTVAIAYTNNTQVFQPGDTGDSITITATNTSATDASSTLMMTLTVPGSITVTSLVDSSGGTWSCANLVCIRTSALTAGSSDSVTLTFNIAANAVIGQTSLTTALSGGNLSSTGQCGRVLYNDYHVEQQSGQKYAIFPSECNLTGKLTPQEKFLEFSLYNLSNFVSPTATDLFDIQGTPTITWANPLTSIYYGTTPYTTTQFPAASYNGAPVAGVFSYIPALATVLPVGIDQVCVTFAPADTTDYVNVTTPFCTSITVLPDVTTTVGGAIHTPIDYGQSFTLPAPQVTTAGPATLTEGLITYSITNSGNISTPACTIPLPAGGTCTTTVAYDAGNYTFQACYSDPLGDFANSCSAPYPVVINPDPTTGSVLSNNDPALIGSSITLTATIVAPYAVPAGTVTFYDGPQTAGNAIGTATVSASGQFTATGAVTWSSLITAAHSITACFAPALDPSGTFDFLPICSAPFMEQVILVPPTAQSTITLLNSSANPSILGQSVTFSAVVATTGSFAAVPTGTLSFFDASTQLNPAPIPLDPGGDASFTTATLAVGTHPITAVFTGNSSFAPSDSAVVSQVVAPSLSNPGNGFLLLVNPTAISVGVGNTATVSVNIVALNNFTQTVQLSCSGLPAESTCSFAKGLIPSGGGTTTLSVTPAAPHACGSGSPYFVATNGLSGTLPALTLTALGLFLLRKRRRFVQAVTLAVVLCLLPALNGCSSQCTDFGTQPNTYTFTVTATASGATPPSTAPQVSTQTVQMVVHL
jgi:hypothetical protein